MKTIEAEAVIIPAVEPKIISEVLPVKTNFEDVEAYLSNLVEKYAGLVVTDENQKDMEKTLREVVSIRTGIQKFEINGKRQLKKPVDDFARQCKNLLAIVNSVEAPLKEQLDVYENKRRDELQAAIGREFTAKADTAGLREEYRLFEIPERWFNKTAKWSETCIDIDHVVSDLYSQQVTADNLAELKETRREMGTAYINTVNAEYNLATPLTPDILTDAVLEKPNAEIKGFIRQAAERQSEIEAAARTATAPVSDPVPPTIAPPPIPQTTGWPRTMVLTISLQNELDYQSMQDFLYEMPANIKYDTEIREG